MVLVVVFVKKRPVNRDAQDIVDDVPAILFGQRGESGHWGRLDADRDSPKDVQGPSPTAIDSGGEVAGLDHVVPRVTQTGCVVILIGFGVLLDIAQEPTVAASAFSVAFGAVDLGADKQVPSLDSRLFRIGHPGCRGDHQVVRSVRIGPSLGNQRGRIGKRFVEAVNGQFLFECLQIAWRVAVVIGHQVLQVGQQPSFDLAAHCQETDVLDDRFDFLVFHHAKRWHVGAGESQLDCSREIIAADINASLGGGELEQAATVVPWKGVEPVVGDVSCRGAISITGDAVAMHAVLHVQAASVLQVVTDQADGGSGGNWCSLILGGQCQCAVAGAVGEGGAVLGCFGFQDDSDLVERTGRISVECDSQCVSIGREDSAGDFSILDRQAAPGDQ